MSKWRAHKRTARISVLWACRWNWTGRGCGMPEGFGLSEMTTADVKFITSFISLMRPLVEAIKHIERKAIVTLASSSWSQWAEEEAGNSQWKSAHAAPHHSTAKWDTQQVPVSDNYRIVTMLHPKFKLAFLHDERACMPDRLLLMTYIQRVQKEVAEPTVSTTGSSLTESEDLCSFPEQECGIWFLSLWWGNLLAYANDPKFTFYF